MKKFIKFIAITVITISLTAVVVDFCRFPECYITTWKYQLKNDINKGDETAIKYYENKYIANGRNLFEEVTNND